MLSLPYEIRRDIFEEIGYEHDLSSLARVSRIIHPEAKLLLYRDITVENLPKLIRVCKVICRNKEIALLIRSFRVKLGTSSPWIPRRTADFARSIRNIFSNALRLMTRLGNLTIRMGSHLLYNSHMNANLYVPSLHRSTFQLYSFNSSMFINQDLLHFLMAQPELRHVKLSHSPVDRSLGHLVAGLQILNTPRFLPKLEVISGLDDDFGLPLTGSGCRRITHIRVCSRSAGLLQYLSHSTVKHLELTPSAGFSLGNNDLFRALPSLLPELETLCGLSLSVYSGKEEENALMVVLSGFQKLLKIEVKGNFMDSYWTLNDDAYTRKWEEILRKIHAARPSLRSVGTRFHCANGYSAVEVAQWDWVIERKSKPETDQINDRYGFWKKVKTTTVAGDDIQSLESQGIFASILEEMGVRW